MDIHRQNPPPDLFTLMRCLAFDMPEILDDYATGPQIFGLALDGIRSLALAAPLKPARLVRSPPKTTTAFLTPINVECTGGNPRPRPPARHGVHGRR